MNRDELLKSQQPQPLAQARWDWQAVRRVLVVRLRSIGDTVLATPTLHALKRFLPDAQIDVLLEDWVAPLLDGFEDVDNVVTVERKSAASRARVARALRSMRYDVAYNLHGGTTATFLTRATGATHRVGYADYRYSRLYNHAAPHPSALWGREKMHSVEQQLALVGWTGVPVSDLPPTHLSVTPEASSSIGVKLINAGVDLTKPLALIHPAAAFDTKQWATENFARITEDLNARGITPVAVSAPHEARVVAALQQNSAAPVIPFTTSRCPKSLRSHRVCVSSSATIAASRTSQPPCAVRPSSSSAHRTSRTGGHGRTRPQQSSAKSCRASPVPATPARNSTRPNAYAASRSRV